MATNHTMHFCKRCGRPTPHVQPATHHVFHLLMCVLTLGLWVGIWVLAGVANSSQRTCAVCGRVAGLFG
jgi:ribosomal protein S14